MPRFVFQLEPLLRARKHQEEAHQRAVAQIERQRRELEDTLRRHQRAIAGGKEGLRDMLTGPLDLRSLRGSAGAALHLERQCRRVVLQLAGIHQRLEAERCGLIEAMKQRRAIELLRDRRYEQFKAGQEKAETQALDELAAVRREEDDR